MELENLIGLIPTRLIWETSQTFVEWLDVSNITFSEPFFNETIARCIKDDPNRLRLQTNLDVLDRLHQSQPGLEPTGFIFHTQRCGSTLLSKTLASLPQNLVLSEPRLITEILGGNIFGSLDFLEIQKDEFWPSTNDLSAFTEYEQARYKIKSLNFQLEETLFSEAQRITYLRQVISALGQKRLGCEKNYFIKFSSHHILDFPLIKKAFPNTPCVFVYRNPMEVIVSILKKTWAFDWSINRNQPGIVPIVNTLLDKDVEGISYEEYYSLILASFFSAVLKMFDGGVLLVNYKQLPEAIWTLLPNYFQLSLSQTEKETMSQCTQFYSKGGDQKIVFSNDSNVKKQEATEKIELMVKRWTLELYERLESIRFTG